MNSQRSKRLSRALLFVGCASTILLAASVASLVVLRVVAIEIWNNSEAATLHYRAALDAIAQDERLVVEASRSVHYMLTDGPNQKLGDSAMSGLLALPNEKISFVDDFPLSPPLTVYKSIALGRPASPQESDEIRRQFRIGARLMWFEAAWGGSGTQRQPAYYVSADGNFAIARTTSEPSPMNVGMADASRYFSAMLERFSTVVEAEPSHHPQPYWTRPYVSPISREDTITVLNPVRDPQGKTLGYIAKDFSLEQFSEADKAASPLSVGYAFFSRDLDYAFGHQDEVLRRGLRIPAFQHVLIAGDTAIWWREGVLLIGNTSPSGNWRVAFSLSFREVLAHHPVTACGALIAFVLVSLLTLIGALFIHRRLLEPVERQAKALAESEKFSRTIFEVSPVGLIVIDLEHFRILGRNEPARGMVSENASDDEPVPGRISTVDIARAFHGLSHEWVEVATNDDVSQRRYFTLRFATTSYREQPVVLCAIVDVTHRRLTEQSLADAKHEAEAANAGKSAFLATISHEIRTPLHGTLAALELMSAGKLEDDQRTLIDMMDGSARNLLQLINDLLDFSKLGAGQLALQVRPFNLTDELQQLIRSFAPRALERGVRLRCFISPAFERDVVGDPVRLSQIAANLVSNALKFTSSGYVDLIAEPRSNVRHAHHDAGDPTARAATTAHDAEARNGEAYDDRRCPICLRVVDTGIGIRREQLARLFTPFYQAHRDVDTIQSGTGLGLSIVRDIAALMQGEAHAASTYGKGSEFTVNLILQWAANGPTPEPTRPPLAGLVVQVFTESEIETQFLCRWLRSQSALPVSDSRVWRDPIGSGIVDESSVLAAPSTGEPVRLYAPGAMVAMPAAGQPCVVIDPLGSPRPLADGALIRVSAYSQYGLLLALYEASGRALPNRETLEAVTDTRYGLRVLIVEDHPVNRRLLARQVERFGCEAIVAPDGQHALRYLTGDDRIDLVLTDINMPGLNGYQLARAIRDTGQHMPIYGVTADVVNQETVDRGDAMQGCLPKPLSLAILGPVLRLVAGASSPARKPAADAPRVADVIDSDDLNPSTLPDELRKMVVETMDIDVRGLETALRDANQKARRGWREDIDGTLHRMQGATLALDWTTMTELIRKASQQLSTDSDDIAGVSAVISSWHRIRRRWL